MEIRHVELRDQHILASRHSELAAHHPELADPLMFSGNGSASDFPYLFYAIEDGQIASYFRSFPDTLFDGVRHFRWAWNGDLYTKPAFRGRGIAQKLVEYQLREFDRRDVIWGGVFSSPAALRLYRRMQFSMPGYVSRLCLVRDVRRFLRHHTSNRLIISTGGLIFDVAFAAAQALLFPPSRVARKYCVEVLEKDKFATLLSQRQIVRPEKFFWGADAGWFELRRMARGIDSIFCVRRRAEAEPCAFLIVRDRVRQSHPLVGRYRGVRLMSVMEFGQFDQGADMANALAEASIMLFLESEADLLIEFVTSSPDIERSARRRGFFPMGDGMSFKFMAPRGNQFYGLQTKLSDWHLSHYCGDAFGFE
jgi:GNAT superfamily N-acetyltransferase